MNLTVDNAIAQDADRIAIVIESRLLGTQVILVKDRYSKANERLTERDELVDYLVAVQAGVEMQAGDGCPRFTLPVRGAAGRLQRFIDSDGDTDVLLEGLE